MTSFWDGRVRFVRACPIWEWTKAAGSHRSRRSASVTSQPWCRPATTRIRSSSRSTEASALRWRFNAAAVHSIAIFRAFRWHRLKNPLRSSACRAWAAASTPPWAAPRWASTSRTTTCTPPFRSTRPTRRSSPCRRLSTTCRGRLYDTTWCGDEGMCRLAPRLVAHSPLPTTAFAL